jgi:hypothetical protein
MMAIAFGAALGTIVPYPNAGEASIMGYKALCPFAPVSTTLLFYSGLLINARIKQRRLEKRRF